MWLDTEDGSDVSAAGSPSGEVRSPPMVFTSSGMALEKSREKVRASFAHGAYSAAGALLVCHGVACS